jgi:hypothetical protein
MADIEIKPAGDNRIAVKSPYNVDFVRQARRLAEGETS